MMLKVTQKAEALQHQICRVFTREPGGDIPLLEPRTAEKLAAVEVTPDIVLKSPIKLNVGGPTEGACSMAVHAMITRPRTSALRMPSTHPAIGNANHR